MLKGMGNLGCKCVWGSGSPQCSSGFKCIADQCLPPCLQGFRAKMCPFYAIICQHFLFAGQGKPSAEPRVFSPKAVV